MYIVFGRQVLIDGTIVVGSVGSEVGSVERVVEGVCNSSFEDIG